MTTFTSDGPYISVTFDGVNAQICFSASDARTFARKLSTAADELEPAPAAQTTLTQALEALEASTDVIEQLLQLSRALTQKVFFGALQDDATLTFDRVEKKVQARIAANRALLQAANAEPDAAGSK